MEGATALEVDAGADLHGDFVASVLTNPDLLVVGEKFPGEKKRVAEEGGKDLEPVPKKREGKKKKMKEPKVEEDEEEKMSRWTDAEATSLIHLRGEMIHEFNKNAKK
jgi:hypothetical protein